MATNQDESGLDEAIDFIELQQHESLNAGDEVRL